MALITENNPYFAYYFSENVYSFRELPSGGVEANTWPLLRNGMTVTNTVATSTFAKYQVPEPHNRSLKLAVQWLLHEGYIPRLKGTAVKFCSKVPQASAPGAPSTPPLSPVMPKHHLLRAFHYIDRAINHYRVLITRASTSVPDDFICPITAELMREPVIDREGHTFERSAIEQWTQKSRVCPVGREDITEPLKPNFALRGILDSLWNSSPIPLLPPMTGKPYTQDDTLAQTMLQAARTADQSNNPPLRQSSC